MLDARGLCFARGLPVCRGLETVPAVAADDRLSLALPCGLACHWLCRGCHAQACVDSLTGVKINGSVFSYFGSGAGWSTQRRQLPSSLPLSPQAWLRAARQFCKAASMPQRPMPVAVRVGKARSAE